ncbi:hypothetical protein CJD36_022245 [Flavipsychrobacter stenotrophus]|uniref:Pyrrolo-quinoline quinone repeat domain-containing protein n=1 Tax=Flavipsychrobacter stenotrophus TaxID=2077091 RepID=A0A2S7SQN1_9BACT|nr:PQQ-binding-like beta-propeller repeat protein [Flavipsychrobacter stenotrophus]PQJ08866.1 hypothetical protein CJD36_022245 [Flavipsychrobacter stenotrophus]
MVINARSVLFLFCMLLLGCNSRTPLTNQSPEYKIVSATNSVYGSVHVWDSLLIYCTWQPATVAIKNIITDSPVFSFALQEECYAAPILRGNKLVVQRARGLISCIDIDSKNVQWDYQTEGRNRTLHLAADSIIIASVNGKGLVAINLKTGQLMYKLEPDKNCTLPVGFLYNVTSDDKHLYVAEWERSPLATFDLLTGKLLWQVRTEALYTCTKPVIIDKYIFVGLDGLTGPDCTDANIGGYLLINRSDGVIVLYRESDPVSYLTPPHDSSTVYFTTWKDTVGHLLSLNINTLKTDTLHAYSSYDRIDDDLYLADDNLYFTKRHTHLNRFNIKNHKISPLNSELHSGNAVKYKDITYIIE